MIFFTAQAGQPFWVQAPNSSFHLWTYSAHHSSLQVIPSHPHASATLQTTVVKRVYSSSVQATPSIPGVPATFSAWLPTASAAITRRMANVVRIALGAAVLRLRVCEG